MTLRKIRQRVEQNETFAMLTCYDATTARWLQQADVPALLVGDSAAQVILGYENSLFAPLEFMLEITAAVRRGAPQCLIMADMPFMSYQADDAEAIHNAGRFMTQGMADVVKLEVDEKYVELVGKLVRAGIPVAAHIGWRPQQVRYTGIRTAKVAGRTGEQIDALTELAVQLEQAGASMLLLEQCTAETSERVVEKTSVPVIGCGAGPACHGHVVVLQDLFGMTEQYPSFVKPIAQHGEQIAAAAAQWVRLIESGEYFNTGHPYRMDAQSDVQTQEKKQ